MVVPKDVPVPKSILQNRKAFSANPATFSQVPTGVSPIQRQTQEHPIIPPGSSGATRGPRSIVDDLQKGIDSFIERIIENEHPRPVLSAAVNRQFQRSNAGFASTPLISTTAGFEGPVIHTYSSLNSRPGSGIPTMAPSAPTVYIDLDPDTSDELQKDYVSSGSTTYMFTALPLDRAQSASLTMPFDSSILRGAPPPVPFETTHESARLRGPPPPLPFDIAPPYDPSQTSGHDSPFQTIDEPPNPSFDPSPTLRPRSMYIPPPRIFHHRARGPRLRNTNKELYGLYRNQLVLKKFICPQCGHRCLKKSDLTRHLRVHSGEKPWSCDICMKKFSEKHIFYQHMRKFHPEFCQ